MRGRAARIGQIHLHHLPVAAVQQPLGIGLQSQNGLEDRCQHQRCRRLHDSIARARYACRSVVPGLVLEYQHLSHRLRAYAPVCKSHASLGRPFPPPTGSLEPRLPSFLDTTSPSATLPAQAGLADSQWARACHRQSFPCCYYAPHVRMPPPIPAAETTELSFDAKPIGVPSRWQLSPNNGGSASCSSRSARHSLALRSASLVSRPTAGIFIPVLQSLSLPPSTAPISYPLSCVVQHNCRCSDQCG